VWDFSESNQNVASCLGHRLYTGRVAEAQLGNFWKPMGFGFWARLLERNRPRVESWIDDQCEFLLQATTLLVVYGVFRFLRYVSVSGSLLDLMEAIHQIAAVLVFTRFMYSIVRRAFTPGDR
jgi:hypothetical protein